MKGEWTRYVQRPCPESARRKQCEEKSVKQQERRRECVAGEGKEPKPQSKEPKPKPRPQTKGARWPQTLRLDDYRGPEIVSLLRGSRMAMAVLLPGIVLGAHLYRHNMRRAAAPERRHEAEPGVEPGAARLEAEETGLKVQETSTAEADNGLEKTMVWETVYEQGRDHDKLPSNK